VSDRRVAVTVPRGAQFSGGRAMPVVSILIPVYNEETYVANVIRAVLDAELPEGLGRELIVVDDGSTDGTASAVRALAVQHPDRIQFVQQDRNRGKGAAVRRAIGLARGDFCVFQDADLEYSPDEIGSLLMPLIEGRAEVVYGSRFPKGGREYGSPFWHRAGNRLLTQLSNLFTGLRLTDMETGYKAAGTPLLKSLSLRCNRFGMEPELTAKFAARGCRVVEVPITYRKRTYGQGKKIKWMDGVKAVLAVLYFRLAAGGVVAPADGAGTVSVAQEEPNQ
jgi:glycosyltransferase involved in cell wall biosynthesis